MEFDLKAASDRNRRQRIIDAQEAFTRVEPSLLREEPELMRTKWFDYRFISPIEATERFAQAYVDAFRMKYCSNFDIATADRRRALMHGGLRSNPREFTSLWRARCYADKFGMPYGFFLDHCIECFMRRGYERIPRPNQLVTLRDYEIEGVVRQWEDYTQSNLQFSRLPEYRNELFNGCAAQRDHHVWLIERLRTRDDYFLGKVCYIDKVLPVDVACEAFGLERVERARASVEREGSIELQIESDTDLNPSCFGVPHAYVASGGECSGCVFAARCSAEENIVRSKLAAGAGTENPVKAHHNELNRVRVARSRQKKKVAAAFASSSPA